MRSHIRPFTEVLRKIFGFLTQKNANHGLRDGTDDPFKQKVMKKTKALCRTAWVFYRRKRKKETLADSESGSTVSHFFLVNADASSFNNPEFACGLFTFECIDQSLHERRQIGG